MSAVRLSIGEALPVRLRAALDKARTYLLGRQSVNGGFCFYRSAGVDEPNPFDTWHAVAALRRLGALPVNPDQVAAFVSEAEISSQPYGLYYRVRTLQVLGFPDPKSPQVREMVARLPLHLGTPPSPFGGLERLRLILALKRHFSLDYPKDGIGASLMALEQPEGGFGLPPNLLDTRLALSILSFCDRQSSAATRAFVANLETPGFGFRLTANSLSPTLETLCAGIACCHHLDLPITYADDALHFILSCQGRNGGFSRATGALPDIGMTHLAISALATLAGPLPALKVSEECSS